MLQVGLGKVRWVAPSGVLGFGPLASVGPVSLGPGAAEKSSLEILRVIVCVDPLQSLLQQKLILQLHADQAQVLFSALMCFWSNSLDRAVVM